MKKVLALLILSFILISCSKVEYHLYEVNSPNCVFLTPSKEIENMANKKKKNETILYIINVTFYYDDFVYNGTLVDDINDDEAHQLYLNDYKSKESNYYIFQNASRIWLFDGYLNNISMSAYSRTVTLFFVDFNDFNNCLKRIFTSQNYKPSPNDDFSINALYL
jgi:hypothetical protein